MYWPEESEQVSEEDREHSTEGFVQRARRPDTTKRDTKRDSFGRQDRECEVERRRKPRCATKQTNRERERGEREMLYESEKAEREAVMFKEGVREEKRRGCRVLRRERERSREGLAALLNECE